MNLKKQQLCYSAYRVLSALLNAQISESAKHGNEAHEQMLFIITHQIYEFWFKQILHALYFALALFAILPPGEKELHTLAKRIQRIINIQFVINQHLCILKTMTPLNFLDYLIPASGLQSIQFREIKLRFGLSHHLNNNSSDKRIYADLFTLSIYLIPRSKSAKSLVRNLGFYRAGY